MTKIYTRKGDKGETTICGMEATKNHPRLVSLGDLDELGSILGVVLSLNPDLKVLQEIQADLMEIGTGIAGEKREVEAKLKRRTAVLEEEVDKMWKDLPTLKNFILPGGCRIGSLLHLSRAVCRRAERGVVFVAQKERIPSEIIAYLNRLSDFLFTLARWVNYKEGYKEKLWP
ncbi:MAG: cob(I)yrinic acid a,c-diamide adenosyltransferase [bacterium]|nr:cob(I)yrinic acid a,c-diamide adenosyltransferase [bacterium]